MKEIKSFWLYPNTYGIVDTYNSLWYIGTEDEMSSKLKELEENTKLPGSNIYAHCAPFEIVKLSDETTSVIYNRYNKQIIL